MTQLAPQMCHYRKYFANIFDGFAGTNFVDIS